MPLQNSDIRMENGAENYNKHYMRIASLYRNIKWAALLLFTLYLTVMLLFNRENITYENMLYLMRDLDIRHSTDSIFAPVIYEPQQQMRFTSYRKELAVAGSSGLRLYNASGSCILDDSLSFKTPAVSAGDKYLLLYDSGGYEYAIFTSLSRISRKTTEGMIQAADMSDSGRYLIVTRSADAKYKITLYSTSFSEIATYYRDSYVIAAALSESGQEVAVLSLEHGDWTLGGYVSLYRDDSTESRTVSLGGALPIAASYMSNGNLSVVCDSSYYCISPEGEILSHYAFDTMTLSCFDISDENTALVVSSSVLRTENRLLLFDSQGNLSLSADRQEKIISVCAGEENTRAYAVYGSTVELLTPTSAEYMETEGHILAVCEIAGYPLLCTSSGASAASLTPSK